MAKNRDLSKLANRLTVDNNYNVGISGSLTVTGSIISTVTTLWSGSAQLPSGVVSGSAQTIANLPSGTVSGSAQTIANLPSGTVSGSAQVDVMSTTNIARLATTGSNTFQGSQTINGNLVVTGSLTAQQFIVSSSVTYLTESFASGSHKFGDSSDDTHQFTGSVYVNGTLNVNNGTIFTTASSVSIGSTNPTEKLDVYGSIRFRTALQSDSYYATLAQNGYYTGAWLKYSSGYARTIQLGDGISFKISNAGAGNAGDGITFITPLAITDAGNTIVTGSLTISGSVGIYANTTASGSLQINTIGNNGTNALVFNGGTNYVNTYMGSFSEGLYISSNYSYASGHRSDSSAKRSMEMYMNTDEFDINTMAAATPGTRVRLLTVSGSAGFIGVGTSSPKTRLQVTPASNAEVPVLGTATGVATFTSANGNYGIQFNSTSDGSFHIQSQRFDASATAYSLILNYAGGNVGIGGNTAPGCSLDISSRTDAIALPKGTTAQRPVTSVAGMGRFNTTTTRTEFYNGSVWVNVGGNADGSTSASAAASAKAIKQVVGNPTSGVYWLQVANVNGGNPFQCYCDFTMDGGVGYAIIVNQYFAGAQTGPSHANFASTTIGTAGFETGYVVSPSAMLANYGLTKLAVFARTGGVTTGGITGSTYYNWVSFTGPTTTQFNNIFTNGYGTNQFTGTFNSSDGNTGTAYFPNTHGNTGGVTQISANGGTVNDYIVYEYNANGGTDPNHFWMVLNGRSGDTYWVNNTRYGSSSGNVMYNRWGGVAIY